jgi:hypothetical protein
MHEVNQVPLISLKCWFRLLDGEREGRNSRKEGRKDGVNGNYKSENEN